MTNISTFKFEMEKFVGKKFFVEMVELEGTMIYIARWRCDFWDGLMVTNRCKICVVAMLNR